MRLIDQDMIARTLDYPKLIDQLAKQIPQGFTAPPRHFHHMENNADFLLLMPAWNERWIGVKMSGVFPDNPARGAEVVAETYLLMDRSTGRTEAVFDALELTNRRTAAASALAARALARPNASTLLVMGTGSLAPCMAEAHASVRSYSRILIWGRDEAKADAVAETLRARGLPAEAAAKAEAAVREADVVTTVTSSSEPIIHGAWLSPGQHIDLVGAHSPNSREADTEAMTKSLVFADVTANVLREAGEILIPLGRNEIKEDVIRGDLLDLIDTQPADHRSEDDITLFKSVGFAAEDLIAAMAALDG
ncbi:MAG: ornithine cyclodeaminase family protein [Pacificimonas sp.]|jgi:ornithine cyclodeaminase|nr:ornithine cyclodeaminase family protein [Pacificimonas sp.]